jgi:Spy/CpxP family protein refolding chaperone
MYLSSGDATFGKKQPIYEGTTIRSSPVSARPSLSVLAMFCALLGAGAAAGAQTYPLPTAPPANAGPADGASGAAQHPARRRFRAALQALGLSPAQRTQIRSMIVAFRASRGSATPMTRRQLLTQIDGVLTPQQRSQFDAAMHPHRQAAPAAAPQNS